MPEPVAIDPPDCACTECCTGLYVPIAVATPEQIASLLAGRLRNNTGMSLNEVARAYVTCGPERVQPRKETHQTPYDALLARLEKERAHHESCAALSRTDEGRIAHSGMASGFHIAAVHLVEETEGPGAAREYMERTTDEAGPAPDAPFDRAAEREQYEAQVHKALRDYGEGDEDPGTGSDYGDQTAVVMCVRDVEVERLRAKRDQLAGQVDQLIDRLGQYADRGIANGVRAEQAEVALARVRAECDAIARDVRGKNPVALAGFREANARIRAALDGPAAEPPGSWQSGGRHTSAGPAGTAGEDPPDPEYEPPSSAAEPTPEQPAREAS